MLVFFPPLDLLPHIPSRCAGAGFKIKNQAARERITFEVRTALEPDGRMKPEGTRSSVNSEER